MEQLLRTQMQARYGPERLGHFGLALATYAHFTSPIRRYADLLVHRGLVRAYKLGDGGLPPGEEERFDTIGEQISMLERRAMEAERDTVDRYVAAFLADRVGQLVECRITGVQPFGFFATVEDLGGDGLVLARDLGREYFRYDEAARVLVGEETRRDLSRRPAADAPPCGGQSGVWLAPLRASRGQLSARLAAAAAGSKPSRRSRQARPPRQHPSSGQAPPIKLATIRRTAHWAGKGERHGLQDRNHRRQPSRRQHQPQGCALDLRASQRQPRLLDDRDRRPAAL